MAYRITCLVCVFLSAVISTLGYDNNEIVWGHPSSDCMSEYVKAPTTEMTYDVPNEKQPIVGIFVTRDVIDSVVWGTGFFWDWGLWKPYCYRCTKTTYSVGAGPADAPYRIYVTFGTEDPSRCSYGYNVKICFKPTSFK